jgi:enamine deaminase RidA (YjgF/YER057c/UK114 family)
MPAKGVKLLDPDGAIEPTGTWSVGSRAGDFVYVAGMRGIDPATNTLVDGVEARITQAFLNMQLIAKSEGALSGRYQSGSGKIVGGGAVSTAHDFRGVTA